MKSQETQETQNREELQETQKKENRKMTHKVKVLEVSTREGSETSFDEFDLSDFVSINEATQLLNFKHAQYTRRLLLEGKLEGVKLAHKGYAKWYITLDSIEFYNAHTSRDTSMRRYILRIDASNENAVLVALGALNIEFKLELAYKSKK